MTGALATWVPSDVLVGALTLLLGAVFKVVIDSRKEARAEMAAIKQALIDMDKRHAALATVEMLGRMGDRFDGRIQSLERDQAVAKYVMDHKP